MQKRFPRIFPLLGEEGLLDIDAALVLLLLKDNKDASENLKNRIVKLFGFKINIDIYTIDAYCCMLYYKYQETKSYISLSEYIIIGRKLMMNYGAEISSKYQFVFFDEFQDVNSKQFDILNQFVIHGCYLTVIGDDSQNIYQFRGTDNYFMINFDNIFKNTSTYTLTTNYRSCGHIIHLANNAISYNVNQVKKIMKTKFKNGKIPKFILSRTEDDQINFIMEKIKKYIDNGLNPSEICILSRNNYHLKIIETELTKRNIPHIACITDKIGENLKKMIEPNKLVVTTIHKSKGLEWSKVFILGFCNQHFPSQMNNNLKNIEEERRLFYVGVTRAKNSLYLMATHSEIPISCFIKENLGYIKIKYNPKNSKLAKDIYNTKNENMIKEDYSVKDLILLLNTETIDELRNNNFLLDIKPEISDMFISLDLEDKIQYTHEIKKGSYEPDFGEFVDRYITRDIMLHSKQEFKDNDVIMILNAIILTPEEMEIYNTYIGCNKLNLDSVISKKDMINEHILFTLLKKINSKKTNNHSSIIRENTYPNHFINNLTTAYKNCQSVKQSNEIIEDIYMVSLCRNLNNDRRRLVYRNIFNLYETMLNNGIRNKMNQYIDLKKPNSITCKKTIYHKFRDVAVLLGEIDLIDWTEETLVDIKCSESEFRLEWYLQCLFYYTFLNHQDKAKIKYLGIANIMDGKYYKLEVPKINYDSLISYMEIMIKRDQNNHRASNNPLHMSSLEYTFDVSKLVIKEIMYKQDNKNYIIIIDTETSSFYNDILQLAYVICDKSGNIIKQVNSFVKNRLPSTESIKIHGITHEKIKKDGKDFYLIIEELMKDISTCETIVGHNIHYDLSTIQNDIRSYGINIIKEDETPMLNILENIKTVDTITLAGKKIKLEELYMELFNKKIIGAHNALNDVLATKECYFSLLNKGL
jgi:DNA polymerase III epsilon subunit-like protein